MITHFSQEYKEKRKDQSKLINHKNVSSIIRAENRRPQKRHSEWKVFFLWEMRHVINDPFFSSELCWGQHHEFVINNNV